MTQPKGDYRTQLTGGGEARNHSREVNGAEASGYANLPDPSTLIALAADVVGIEPHLVLVGAIRPRPLARHMVARFLVEHGWTNRDAARVLGRDESTIGENRRNFKSKLKGPNGYRELYEAFCRRAQGLP